MLNVALEVILALGVVLGLLPMQERADTASLASSPMSKRIFLIALLSVSTALIGYQFGMHRRVSSEADHRTGPNPSVGSPNFENQNRKLEIEAPSKPDRLPVLPDQVVESAPIPVGELLTDPEWKEFDPELTKSIYEIPWKDWDGYIERADPLIWEAKYGHLSLEELNQAKAAMDLQVTKTQMKLFAERREAGLVAINQIQYKTLPDGTQKRIGVNLQMVSKGGLGTPTVQSAHSYDDQGHEISELLWLPPDEYPDYYSKIDEQAWMGNQLKKLMSVAMAPK